VKAGVGTAEAVRAAAEEETGAETVGAPVRTTRRPGTRSGGSGRARGQGRTKGNTGGCWCPASSAARMRCPPRRSRRPCSRRWRSAAACRGACSAPRNGPRHTRGRARPTCPCQGSSRTTGTSTSGSGAYGPFLRKRARTAARSRRPCRAAARTRPSWPSRTSRTRRTGSRRSGGSGTVHRTRTSRQRCRRWRRTTCRSARLRRGLRCVGGGCTAWPKPRGAYLLTRLDTTCASARRGSMTIVGSIKQRRSPGDVTSAKLTQKWW
jgi:hypothetical protein